MTNLSRVKEMIINNEGCISYMYLDTMGYVTVGVGHMIPSAEEAKKLGFVRRGTEDAASAVEVENEFEYVKGKEAGRAAPYYRQFTQLDLPEHEIDVYLEKHIHEFESGLRSEFPDYDSYPEEAKEAMLDMAFNLGLSGLVNKFPKFTAAAKNKEWSVCAEECTRRGIRDARNNATKELFKKAAGRE